MRAAKQPIDPQLVADASVAVDIMQRWAEDEDDAPSPTLMVYVCPYCGIESSAPQDHREIANVRCTACPEPRPFMEWKPSAHESELALIHRVRDAAIGEYLRRKPKSRNPNGTAHLIAAELDEDEKPTGEWAVVCIFCAKPLNTLPPGRRISNDRFWTTINRHTWLCAAMFAADMIEAAGVTDATKRLPLAKLKGGALRSEADDACEYLGIPKPKRGRYGVGARAHVLRWIIADARRLADARHRLERDGDPNSKAPPSLKQARAYAETQYITRFEDYLRQRYADFPNGLRGLPWNDRRPGFWEGPSQ